MDKVEQLVRTIFILYGQTCKIPIEEIFDGCYDYEENHIIQKMLYHHELKERLMREGYTDEQAENIISESLLRGIIDYASLGEKHPENRDADQYILTNEEYWVNREEEHLGYFVIEVVMKSEVKDYVVEYLFHSGDENEEKLREVYAEYNKKELTREELVEGLLRKGYTKGEIEEILKKYTAIEVPEEERKKWDEASKLFRRPEYKPLKHHKSKRIARKTNGNIIVEDIPNCYEIMQIEEWKLKEYEDLNYLRQSARYIYGTRKVPFRAIRKIFRDAENQGKRTLKRNELIRRIVEECNTTEEEAEIATHGAELTFKIRAVTPALRKIWRLGPFTGEVEYYWSGTTSEYPPFTLQDRVFNPIIETLGEAEKEGRKELTHEELLQKAYKHYQEYRKSHRSVPLKTITREFIETILEDAEELLLIIRTKENHETKYKLNYQIIKHR